MCLSQTHKLITKLNIHVFKPKLPFGSSIDINEIGFSDSKVNAVKRTNASRLNPKIRFLVESKTK